MGAVLEGDDSVRVWSCTLDSSDTAQPVRCACWLMSCCISCTASAAYSRLQPARHAARLVSGVADSAPACMRRRRLQRSPPLQCESAESAEKVVALLQQQSALNHRKGDGGMQQRRALVIVNPHSGQGL